MSIGYYHQEPGKHPDSDVLPPCMERVEVVTGGRGWVLLEGEYAEVTAGALLWHVAGDRTISRSDFADPYRCLSVYFQTKRQRGPRRVPHFGWWRDIDAIEAFIREIIRAYVDEGFDRQALLDYTYGRLLFQARLGERSHERSGLPEKLRCALELMESQSWPLRDIARKVGWSVAHLHEVCRLKLNTTPHKIALRRRMQAACERLAGSDQPLKQIATECGFSSASAFCHAFRQRMGQTPLRYREVNQRH
jgi:AraC-like DNA-binding protein